MLHPVVDDDAATRTVPRDGLEDAGSRITAALSQHRIEAAFAFWHNGASLAAREPQPRRQAYEHAIVAVVETLAEVSSIPALVAAYYQLSEARWQALKRACDVDTGLLPPNGGIVEDAAFYRRYQALLIEGG